MTWARASSPRVVGPESMRTEPCPLKTGALVTRCACLQAGCATAAEQPAPAMALRLTARRIQAAEIEAAKCEAGLVASPPG